MGLFNEKTPLSINYISTIFDHNEGPLFITNFTGIGPYNIATLLKGAGTELNVVLPIRRILTFIQKSILTKLSYYNQLFHDQGIKPNVL